MAVRALEELRRDQGELLAELQGGAAAPGSAFGAVPAAGPVLRIGKVSQVVTSDATYGPHLLVRPQAYSGQPPEASDLTAPTRRAYPGPGRAVGDYAVNEFVTLGITRGAEFALKLA